MRIFNIIKASHSLESFLQVSVISNMAVKLNNPFQAWIIFPNEYNCKKIKLNEIKIDLVQ